jgi:hypothetical protein
MRSQGFRRVILVRLTPHCLDALFGQAGMPLTLTWLPERREVSSKFTRIHKTAVFLPFPRLISLLKEKHLCIITGTARARADANSNRQDLKCTSSRQ